MGNKNNDIRHSGIVEYVSADGTHVKVRISQTSACASCKAASYCASAESKEKTIDVFDVQCAEPIHIGEEVAVSVSTVAASTALLWAFGAPFIILVGVLFILVLSGIDELQAALWSIGALIPYYILLYLLRNHFRQRIRFHLEGRLSTPCTR